jgi:hypothetical protein
MKEGFTIDEMISQSIPLDIKNQLGTLLQTKKMNAPAFFSF